MNRSESGLLSPAPLLQRRRGEPPSQPRRFTRSKRESVRRILSPASPPKEERETNGGIAGLESQCD